MSNKIASMKNSILMDKCNKSDARAIAKWWNANSSYYCFIRKMCYGKFWEVYHQ